jgi:hypothetical protein
MSLIRSSNADKRCNACGVVKPLDQFYRNNATLDGRTTRCRVCVRGAASPDRSFSPVTLRADPINRFLTEPLIQP